MYQVDVLVICNFWGLNILHYDYIKVAQVG